MRKRNEADMIVRLTSFSLPVVGTQNKMNYQSFMDNVINSPKFNQRLDAGLIMGLNTHSGRDEADANRTETPYDDLIAKHKDLANVARDVWVEKDTSGVSAYASLDLLDGLPATDLVKVLLKNKLFVGVSMATRSNYDAMKKEYMIMDLRGVDFTRDPAFIASGIVQQNFSAIRPDTMPHEINFSSNVISKPSIVYMNDTVNFAFRDWLRELKRPRFMILHGRIRDVIRNLKTMKPEEIERYKLDIRAYVNDIIINSINLAIDSDKKINIQVLLRINPFLDNPGVAQKFNTKANMAKNLYDSSGYFTKQSQNMLSEAINLLLESLWRYIADKSGIEYKLIDNKINEGQSADRKIIVGKSESGKEDGKPAF